jgi:hypothetical protein
MLAWAVAEPAIAAAYVLLMVMAEARDDDDALQAAAHLLVRTLRPCISRVRVPRCWCDGRCWWLWRAVLCCGWVGAVVPRHAHKCGTRPCCTMWAVCVLQAGYHAQEPLTEQEWQLVPVLMAARLLQSTIIGLVTVSKVSGTRESTPPHARMMCHAHTLSVTNCTCACSTMHALCVVCMQEPGNAAYVMPDEQHRWCVSNATAGPCCRASSRESAHS